MRKVTMMLADHADAVGGKLYINGGGWTWTGPQPTPFAIALLFEVPWDEASDRQEFRLELVDSDGEAVMVPGPEGEQPLWIGGSFETGRPAGTPRGTPVTFPVSINVGAPPLQPGMRYEWRLQWNDETQDDWRLAFNTRPAEAQA
jgi:hypothetical protein